MDAPQRGEVLKQVAKEVFGFQGQQAVEEGVACGDIDRTADAVVRGVDLSVIDRKIDPERARVVYVLLGFSTGRFEEVLARGWD